jgi:hypothetical protein
MNKTEMTEAIEAIRMMLKAFPSSQSSIGEDSARVYMFAVEEFSLEAIERACRAIVRGEVKDLKADFPPSAPRLAQIVLEHERSLMVEQYEATHTFVEEGSELWRKLEHYRGRSLPVSHRDGRKGWSVSNDMLAEADKVSLPAPPEREPFVAAVPGSRIEVGDPEGNTDAGEAA